MMSYRPLALAAVVAALLSIYVTGAEAQPAYVAPGSVYIGAGAGPVYVTPGAPAAAYVGRRGYGNWFEAAIETSEEATSFCWSAPKFIVTAAEAISDMFPTMGPSQLASIIV